MDYTAIYFQSFSSSSCFFKELTNFPEFCTHIWELLTNLIHRQRKSTWAAIQLLELMGNKCLSQWHKSIGGRANGVIWPGIFNCCKYMWNQFEYLLLLSHPCQNRLTQSWEPCIENMLLHLIHLVMNLTARSIYSGRQYYRWWRAQYKLKLLISNGEFYNVLWQKILLSEMYSALSESVTVLWPGRNCSYVL